MPFSIRPSRRFPVCCPVTYHWGLFEGHGIVWNLSLTGWRFSGNLPLRIREVCSLTVNLPTQPRLYVAAGIVRWVRGEEYGVETLVADRTSLEDIAHYVRDQAKIFIVRMVGRGGCHMKLLVVLAALSMTTLSGCVAELFVIRTVEEIKRSEAHAEYASPKAPDIVTSCMMQTFYNFTNEKGNRPYAEVRSQTFGATQTITLRTGKNRANQMYGGGDEMLFLVENSVRDGGTNSAMWSNQNLVSPSPKEYLNSLAGVVKVCL